MGLLDIINGMQNGPRGQHQPTGTGAKASAGGGMSPIMMALLGLVAYKAVKSFGGGQPANPSGAAGPASLPPGGTVTPAIRAEGSATSWAGCSAASPEAHQPLMPAPSLAAA